MTPPLPSATRLATPVSRGLAAFLSGFTLLNLLGDRFTPGFDANVWWIDLRPLPNSAAFLLLLTTALLSLAYAARPPRETWRRRATACAATVLCAFAVWNAVGFFALLARGRIHSGFPVPLSLLTFAALLLILRQSLLVHPPAPAPSTPARGSTDGQNPPANLTTPAARPRVIAATVLICLIGFPLAQMLCFGHTDYRDFRDFRDFRYYHNDRHDRGPGRPADVIVVFGARTYADGTPSLALADRVRTACDLYRQGYAERLVFSGGPGDGAVTEPQAMRQLALNCGVPDSAITCDPLGLNTDATVRNTQRLFDLWHTRRVLVVSHSYHLPRVKMAYRRQGRDVYTVPARESRPLRRMPYLVCREVAALWAYYLRPL